MIALEITESAWVSAKSSVYVLWLLAWYFVGILDGGSSRVFCLPLGSFFSSWVALPSLDLRFALGLIVSCCALFD